MKITKLHETMQAIYAQPIKTEGTPLASQRSLSQILHSKSNIPNYEKTTIQIHFLGIKFVFFF